MFSFQSGYISKKLSEVYLQVPRSNDSISTKLTDLLDLKKLKKLGLGSESFLGIWLSQCKFLTNDFVAKESVHCFFKHPG